MTGNESQTTQPTRDVTRERIDDWRRRLIALSYRNRLIKYRPTQATTLTIEAPTIHELVAAPGRSEPWQFFFPPEEKKEDNETTSEAADFVDETIVRTAGRGARA